MRWQKKESKLKTGNWDPIWGTERKTNSLRHPWDTIKHNNIRHSGSSRERGEKEVENFEEILVENFWCLMKDIPQSSSWINLSRIKTEIRTRQITIKSSEVKGEERLERIKKAAIRHVQAVLDKINSPFLLRNTGWQKCGVIKGTGMKEKDLIKNSIITSYRKNRLNFLAHPTYPVRESLMAQQ